MKAHRGAWPIPVSHETRTVDAAPIASSPAFPNLASGMKPLVETDPRRLMDRAALVKNAWAGYIHGADALFERSLFQRPLVPGVPGLPTRVGGGIRSAAPSAVA